METRSARSRRRGENVECASFHEVEAWTVLRVLVADWSVSYMRRVCDEQPRSAEEKEGERRQRTEGSYLEGV